MVDNQHKKITGYRDLNEAEIALMNEIKAVAENVGDLVAYVQNRTVEANQISIDQRWAAEGKTDLQKGFMSLIRSIAQPTTF